MSTDMYPDTFAYFFFGADRVVVKCHRREHLAAWFEGFAEAVSGELLTKKSSTRKQLRMYNPHDAGPIKINGDAYYLRQFDPTIELP
jgi:hypothetical protein